jgi:hypothetical protein
MSHRSLPTRCLVPRLGATALPLLAAAAAAAQQLPEVRVAEPAAWGSASDAASEGTVGGAQLQARPLQRTADLLEAVPGLVVTQHSGEGKANQYFLRGFNLDHGTDFATWVDGMPVNMPTHAHGQGYTDLNFLIPELVARIDWRKGPYRAEDGDFASAGTARIALVDRLPRPLVELGAGQRGWRRALLAGSADAGGGQLLYALEQTRHDGPWTVPQGLRRTNGVLRLSGGEAGGRWSLTAMGSAAAWTATDQVPQRALADGRLGRYDAVDPTDGGDTGRGSLSWNWRQAVPGGQWQASAYAVRARLALWSNFTYALDDPLAGDQFAQRERRTVLGGQLARRWDGLLAGREASTTVGLQWRADRLDPVALELTSARAVTALLQDSRVRQASVGLHAESTVQWTRWLRSIAGLRADQLRAQVASSLAPNSGRAADAIVSPKLSLVAGPWSGTTLYAHAGHGFHSNDARGAVARVTAREGLPAQPVPALVRTRGSELGWRQDWAPGLQTSVALWQLRLDSELVFVGDAGDTAPSRASLRRGVEWGSRWQAARWLRLDADLAWARARYTEDDPAGPWVPGAAARVAALGAAFTPAGPWRAQLQLRHVGPRVLVEDGSVRAPSATLLSARLGWQASATTSVTLDVFNLLGRRVDDISYWYVSRLPGEPAGGIADRHLHPAEPRALRVSLRTAL